MRLLLINPNTSTHITERLVLSARAVMADDEPLTAVTASKGPSVVRSAADLKLAEASAMDLAATHSAGHDAIALGISLDGAAARLRIDHPRLAVVGMTEAALLTACLRSADIGLLTLGPTLLPLYRQRVEQVGIASRVVAYEGPEMTEAFEAGRAGVDAAVLAVLVDAATRLRDQGAGSIVLAGAVLCGYAAAIATQCQLPVFDGVSCAVGQIRNLLATPPFTGPAPQRPVG